MTASKLIRNVLKKSWGVNFMQLFKEFDPYPIAAASIGQVHKCVLKNNDIVAIKGICEEFFFNYA